MASAPVLDRDGKKVADRDLPSDLFEAPINVPLMHQVVVAALAALRAGTHSTKTRGEVSGGGRKPWRQKGTGRARHGSTRSPIWTGGGVSHGPKPRDHSLRVNKKMKRGALRSALTDALRSEKLALVDELSFDTPRTKDAAGLLEKLELQGKILLVLDAPDATTERSFRNLRQVKVTYARSLSVYDLLAADRVLMTGAALDTLEGTGPSDQEGEGTSAASGPDRARGGTGSSGGGIATGSGAGEAGGGPTTEDEPAAASKGKEPTNEPEEAEEAEEVEEGKA